MFGKRQKREQQQKNAYQMELEAIKKRFRWCAHCVHGMPSKDAWANCTIWACDLESPCGKFERKSAEKEGQDGQGKSEQRNTDGNPIAKSVSPLFI